MKFSSQENFPVENFNCSVIIRNSLKEFRSYEFATRKISFGNFWAQSATKSLIREQIHIKITEHGQSTIELIITIGFMLLIFIILVFAAGEKTIESNEFKTFIDAKKIAVSITDNINTISILGSGYYRYFSIPAKIYGDYEYEINITRNLVEITWEDYAWSDQLITSNVTVFCLDKGMNKKNKILNDNENILITCYRPDLAPVNGTIKPYSAGANSSINVSIDITNFGVLNSGPFVVLFNSNGVNLSGLNADQTITVSMNFTTPNYSGNWTIEIYIDSNNEINESIESDNFYNGTIRIQ